MTSTTPQCGRTYVHGPHETTEGYCPGLPLLDPPLGPPLVIRMPRRKDGNPEILNPEVLGGRGVLVISHNVKWEHIEQPMASTFADAEPDPLRSWMLAYPGPSVPGVVAPGSGPGWGDDSDVENARCCPWCRGSLTEHNRDVHDAGYDMGARHTQDIETARERLGAQVAEALDLPRGMVSERDPWASDGAGYDVRVLRDGIQAIASDALVREDFGTAAYAYSVLAGDPIAPRDDNEPDTSAEDLAPRVYMASAQTILVQAPIPEVGLLVLPGEAPTGETINATTPEGDESCGASAYGVRFAACDLPAGHNSQHHAWYDAGYGPTTILWENLR